MCCSGRTGADAGGSRSSAACQGTGRRNPAQELASPDLIRPRVCSRSGRSRKLTSTNWHRALNVFREHDRIGARRPGAHAGPILPVTALWDLAIMSQARVVALPMRIRPAARGLLARLSATRSTFTTCSRRSRNGAPRGVTTGKVRAMGTVINQRGSGPVTWPAHRGAPGGAMMRKPFRNTGIRSIGTPRRRARRR